MRSLPSDSDERYFWLLLGSYLIRRNNGDRLGLAIESAMLDAYALQSVMRRVEKDDNLREVVARALRSIREALLHAGVSYEHAAYAYVAIKRRIRSLSASASRSKHEYVDASDSDSELAKFANTFHAFLTSVHHLLTFVFQYLAGYVDRGGSKTYSSGAFDFRASFVALVLFQGAYVWIKFRQAARPVCRTRKAPDVVDIEECNLKGLHKLSIKNASGDFVRFKYEPRFKPPRQEGDDGTDGPSRRLPLGEHHTRAEALIVLQTARHYYDKDEGCVELEGGRCKFLIPPMSEQVRGLAGKEKRKWVTRRAKQVGKQLYADFQREMKGKHVVTATEADPHARAEFNDPSSFALPLPCPSLPMLPTMVAEPATPTTAPSSPSLPLLPCDGASVGDAYDSSKAPSVLEDMLAELLDYDPGLSNLPNRQSSVVSYQMQYQGFAQLLQDPSLPDDGTVQGGIEQNSERELNPSPSFQDQRDLVDVGAENIDGRDFLPQSVPDLQQLLLCQKKRLEENARQFVDLDHQLKAYQIQNSRLQQENESLKSRLEQVAKAQVATWTGIMMDIQQRD